MRKTIKTLCDFLKVNHDANTAKKEKFFRELADQTPKMVLLTCPYPLRFLEAKQGMIYSISSYGGTIPGNEISLDYALRTLAIPVLVIFGHEDCSAVKGALSGQGTTRIFHEMFQSMAPAFEQGRSRKFRDNVLKHIDYQVSLALDRYHDLVKGEKLVVAGCYSDNSGSLFLTNYNGLRGMDSLCHALPDVDSSFFLE